MGKPWENHRNIAVASGKRLRNYVTNWKDVPCYQWGKSTNFRLGHGWAMSQSVNVITRPGNSQVVPVIQGFSQHPWFGHVWSMISHCPFDDTGAYCG